MFLFCYDLLTFSPSRNKIYDKRLTLAVSEDGDAHSAMILILRSQRGFKLVCLELATTPDCGRRRVLGVGRTGLSATTKNSPEESQYASCSNPHVSVTMHSRRSPSQTERQHNWHSFFLFRRPIIVLGDLCAIKLILSTLPAYMILKPLFGLQQIL